jgi:hypothetical protein
MPSLPNTYTRLEYGRGLLAVGGVHATVRPELRRRIRHVALQQIILAGSSNEIAKSIRMYHASLPITHRCQPLSRGPALLQRSDFSDCFSGIDLPRH